MVENGYLVQERSVHDRRSIRVKLSEKGHAIRTLMNEVFERHIANVENSGLDLEKLKDVNDALKNLERFLTGQVGYSPLNQVPA